MGANPMQKMKRNAILTGLIIGLIVGLIMCVILYLFLTQASGGLAKDEETVTVCVLNRTIKSGEVISEGDITTINVSSDAVPADATTQVINGIAKIDLAMGTVLGESMLNATSDAITADLRKQEYNMITLPTQLSAGDYIDIRLQLPSGADYIVISKKQVVECDASTVWLNMNEEEILTMSNAIIEYYIMAGSKLYAITYTDPGIQKASTPTYCPNSNVVALINGNPNITSQITDGQGRFSEALKNIRNTSIKEELNNYSETRLENIEKSIQQEIQTLQESREAYFGVLDGEYEEEE